MLLVSPKIRYKKRSYALETQQQACRSPSTKRASFAHEACDKNQSRAIFSDFERVSAPAKSFKEAHQPKQDNKTALAARKARSRNWRRLPHCSETRSGSRQSRKFQREIARRVLLRCCGLLLMTTHSHHRLPRSFLKELNPRTKQPPSFLLVFVA